MNFNEAPIIEWAEQRGLFSPANPIKQAAKTLEEVGEAKAALCPVDSRVSQKEAALELGDILVTLTIQAHAQGSSLAECIRSVYKVGQLFKRGQKRWTWDKVDFWVEALMVAVEEQTSVRPMIGVVYKCVEDAAAIQLAMSPAECLALAYEKIRDRQGQTIDGEFVKA